MQPHFTSHVVRVCVCVCVHKHKKGIFFCLARVGQSHPVVLLPLLESQCQSERRAMNERKSAASEGEEGGFGGCGGGVGGFLAERHCSRVPPGLVTASLPLSTLGSAPRNLIRIPLLSGSWQKNCHSSNKRLVFQLVRGEKTVSLMMVVRGSFWSVALAWLAQNEPF